MNKWTDNFTPPTDTEPMYRPLVSDVDKFNNWEKIVLTWLTKVIGGALCLFIGIVFFTLIYFIITT